MLGALRPAGALIVALAVAAVGCRGEEGTSGNLLAGLTPESESVRRAARASDGVAPREGDAWNGDGAALFDGVGASVKFDLGQAKPIDALWLQADANDSYLVSTSLDGRTFDIVWVAQPVDGAGLRQRFVSALARSARFVRVQAYGGDGLHAVGELMAFSGMPDQFPPDVPRLTARRIDERARTSFLYLGLALLAWVAIGRRAGTLGSLAGLGAVLLAGWFVLEAMRAAWPLPQRDVSLARGVVAGVAALVVLW
ncbi:MAG: hypothetical protein ACREQJ_03250, partial [Candidatus Binatia bacterium]